MSSMAAHAGYTMSLNRTFCSIAPGTRTITAFAGAAAVGDYAIAQGYLEDNPLLYGVWKDQHDDFQAQLVGYHIVSPHGHAGAARPVAADCPPPGRIGGVPHTEPYTPHIPPR